MFITWTNLWLPCKLLGGCHGKEVDTIKWNLVCPWRYYVHNNGFNSSTLWRGRWLETRNVRSYIFWGMILDFLRHCYVHNLLLHCCKWSPKTPTAFKSIFSNNAASSCWSFWNTWGVQKECATCKLSIYLDNAASICHYFWSNGVSVTLLWI